MFMAGLMVLGWQLQEEREKASRLAEENRMAWDFADSVLGELTETRAGLAAMAADKETLGRALDAAGESRVQLRGELEETQRQQRRLAQMTELEKQQWNQSSRTLKLNLDTEASRRALAESSVAQLENETVYLAKAKQEVQQRNEEALQANRSLAHEAANLQMGVQQLRQENANLYAANQRLESCLYDREQKIRSLESLNSQLVGDVSGVRSCVQHLECRVRDLECELARARARSK